MLSYYKRILSLIAAFFVIILHIEAQTIQWVAQYDSRIPEHIAIDKFNNVYLGGDFTGSVDFDPGPNTNVLVSNGYDGFITKLDQYGNQQWTNKIGGSYNQSVRSIKIDSLGNIYIACDLSGKRLAVQKLNSNGQLIWSNEFYYNSPNLNDYNNSWDLAIDNSGNSYVIGEYYGQLIFSGVAPFTLPAAGSQYDTFIAKIDSSGNLVWVKGFGGPNNDKDIQLLWMIREMYTVQEYSMALLTSIPIPQVFII